MCRAATCKYCQKTTWAGCGQHVDQVMRGVPRNQRCTCTPESIAAAKAEAKAGKGFFGRLFS